ncbi:MAG TPA: PIN domain-containing protein [Galbitalea sp.]
MIVLDANLPIGSLDAADPHHAVSVDLLERRYVDDFATSVLTAAGALLHATRVERQDAAMSALHRIEIEVIALHASDALALARVRNTYRLRMPDAVAVHAAISTRSELATFDDALIAAAERAGIKIAN